MPRLYLPQPTDRHDVALGVSGAFTEIEWDPANVLLPGGNVVGQTFRLMLDDSWSGKGDSPYPQDNSSFSGIQIQFRGIDPEGTQPGFGVGDPIYFGYVDWYPDGGSGPLDVEPWTPGVERALTVTVVDTTNQSSPPLPPYYVDWVELDVYGNWQIEDFTMPYIEVQSTRLALPTRVGVA